VFALAPLSALQPSSLRQLKIRGKVSIHMRLVLYPVQHDSSATLRLVRRLLAEVCRQPTALYKSMNLA
jgi:hypothetical protein